MSEDEPAAGAGATAAAAALPAAEAEKEGDRSSKDSRDVNNAAAVADSALDGGRQSSGSDDMQQDTSSHGAPSPAATAATATAAGSGKLAVTTAAGATAGGPPPDLPLLISPPSHVRTHPRVRVNGSSAGGDGQAVEYLVRFECQLYKLRDEEYAVDVQVRLDCGALAELRCWNVWDVFTNWDWWGGAALHHWTLFLYPPH
jgi:hypothetical protein